MRRWGLRGIYRRGSRFQALHARNLHCQTLRRQCGVLGVGSAELSDRNYEVRGRSNGADPSPLPGSWQAGFCGGKGPSFLFDLLVFSKFKLPVLQEIKECVVCIGSMKLTGLSFKLDERAGGGNLRGKGSAAKKQSSCVVM